MTLSANLNTIFRCGNTLQVFESDSKTGNIPTLIYNVELKIISCNIPLLTVAATKFR